jgi:transmembrane sensor
MTPLLDTETMATPQEAAAAWFGRQRITGLSEADRQAFAAWLEESPEHLEAYEAVERAWSGVEAVRNDPRVMALREDARRRNPPWRRLLAPLAMAAALLVVAPGGAWLAYSVGLIPNHELQTRSYSTALGQRSTVKLPDGSVVTLNTDTVLRTEAAKGRRLIYLDKGQAYFRVAHDPAHPFIVNAAGRTVTAIGTAFDVRVDAGRFQVTLVEGKIRVEAPVPEPASEPQRADDTAPARLQATEMVAGTQLIAGTDTGWKLQEVDAPREVSWTTGQLEFLRRPLSEVVAELNRYSTTRIVIADPKLAAIPITGTFKPGDNTGFAAAVVSYGMATVVEDKDNTIRLTGRS